MLRSALLVSLLLVAANISLASPDFGPRHSLYVMAYRLTNRMNHPDPLLVDDLLRKVDSALHSDPKNAHFVDTKHGCYCKSASIPKPSASLPFPVSELLISGAPFTPHRGERALTYVVSNAIAGAVLLGTGVYLFRRLSLQASASEADPHARRRIFVGRGLVATMMFALFAYKLRGTTSAWRNMALEHATYPFWLWVAISVLAVSVGRTVWEIGVVYRTLRHTAGFWLAFAFTTAFHLLTQLGQF